MSKMVSIGRIGVNISHDNEFIIDRPHGSGDFVFLHFSSPVRILSDAGVVSGRTGACIVYAPPHPQWYTGDSAAFRHDWFHFSGARAPEIFGEYGIPANRILYPARTNFIPRMLAAIQRESRFGESFYQVAIACRLELFFIEFGRALKMAAPVGMTPHRMELLEDFKRIRAGMLDDPASDWSVARLAERVHLSESRFSVLYSEFFGVSPREDVIRARIETACWLLSGTTLNVSQVAWECGFRNIHYFSRLFKKRVGCAPGAFRDLGYAGTHVRPTST